MEPVTIADPFELAGYQRARCYRLIGDVAISWTKPTST